jgi:transglutaminase-like putative cysteine protease
VDIKVDYEITLNRVDFDISNCQGELPDEFNQPELHIESNNPEIKALAKQLPSPLGDTCQQVRAYYDYIGDNLLYTYNGGDWGAQAALWEIGADCTEYASLMVALSRAAAIPARYLEGLQLSGAGNGEARLEHAWLEVFLPGIGWAPFDPTLGRIPGSRERYFAALPADHIIVTVGRHPSTLRGSSYYSHLYWGAAQREIKVEDYHWQITPNGQ